MSVTRDFSAADLVSGSNNRNQKKKAGVFRSVSEKLASMRPVGLI
jgi:hypothetical protein